MAKMNTQTIVITVSELIPTNAKPTEIISPETLTVLTQAVEEMVGSGKLVEIDQTFNSPDQ